MIKFTKGTADNVYLKGDLFFDLAAQIILIVKHKYLPESFVFTKEPDERYPDARRLMKSDVEGWDAYVRFDSEDTADAPTGGYTCEAAIVLCEGDQVLKAKGDFFYLRESITGEIPLPDYCESPGGSGSRVVVSSGDCGCCCDGGIKTGGTPEGVVLMSDRTIVPIPTIIPTDWGNIGGDIYDQTDLKDVLDDKANLYKIPAVTVQIPDLPAQTNVQGLKVRANPKKTFIFRDDIKNLSMGSAVYFLSWSMYQAGDEPWGLRKTSPTSFSFTGQSKIPLSATFDFVTGEITWQVTSGTVPVYILPAYLRATFSGNNPFTPESEFQLSDFEFILEPEKSYDIEDVIKLTESKANLFENDGATPLTQVPILQNVNGAKVKFDSSKNIILSPEALATESTRATMHIVRSDLLSSTNKDPSGGIRLYRTSTEWQLQLEGSVCARISNSGAVTWVKNEGNFINYIEPNRNILLSIDGKVFASNSPFQLSDITVFLDEKPILDVEDVHKNAKGVNEPWIREQFIYGGTMDAIQTGQYSRDTLINPSLDLVKRLKLASQDQLRFNVNQEYGVYGYRRFKGCVFYVTNTYAGYTLGLTLSVGDWVVSTGEGWKKIAGSVPQTSEFLRWAENVSSNMKIKFDASEVSFSLANTNWPNTAYKLTFNGSGFSYTAARSPEGYNTEIISNINQIKLRYYNSYDVALTEKLIEVNKDGVFYNDKMVLTDAPSDGRTYGRKNGEWVPLD